MRAIAEPRAKPKAECFYRPYGTDLPFASFPSPAAAHARQLKGSRSGIERVRWWLEKISPVGT
jgi:hypothetical protein